MRAKIIQVEDGQILAVKSGQFFYLTCCDCDLTHRIDMNIVNREVRMGILRDERRTAQKRRRTRERRRRKKNENHSI